MGIEYIQKQASCAHGTHKAYFYVIYIDKGEKHKQRQQRQQQQQQLDKCVIV